VLSVVSLRACADLVSPPVVVFLDMQREFPSKPQLFASCGIDGVLADRQKTPLIDSSHPNREATSRSKSNGKSADG
jgi:hypothetical protein